MRLKTLLNLYLILILLVTACCTSATSAPQKITWNAYAMGEDISNLYGGIKRGSTYTLAGHLVATLDTNALRWWRDGQLAFGVLGIQQNNYQYLYSGAIQIPSGYTGVPEVRISDLFLQQKFSDAFLVRLGIMDIDDHFNDLEVGLNLMNSAFTNTIALSSNVLLPTYPFPGVGCELVYDVSNWEFQAALFQGNPKHQSTALSKGYFLLGEAKYDLQMQSKRAEHYTFRLGIWEYQPHDSWLLRSEHGLYSSVEVTWNSKRGPQFGAAIQAGLAEEKRFSVPYSVAACLTMTKLANARPKDSLNFGYGIAWINANSALHSETFYEVDYIFSLTDNLILVLPDVQYFVKPSGLFDNAWVLLVRIAYVL